MGELQSHLIAIMKFASAILFVVLISPSVVEAANDTNSTNNDTNSTNDNSSPSKAAVEVYQELTLDIDTGKYVGTLSTLMEFAYGVALNITDKGKYKTGCKVMSEVTGRRAVTVKFTASMTFKEENLAKSNAKALTQAKFATAAKSAKTDLGSVYASVAIPTLTSLEQPECGGSSQVGSKSCNTEGTFSGVAGTSSMGVLTALISITVGFVTILKQ